MHAMCWSSSVGQWGRLPEHPFPAFPPTACHLQHLQWGEEGGWVHPRDGYQPFCTGPENREQHRLSQLRALENIHDAFLGLEYGHTNT